MDEQQSLNHSKWECKYHVVFIPKCRRKSLYGELRRHLGEVFRKLASTGYMVCPRSAYHARSNCSQIQIASGSRLPFLKVARRSAGGFVDLDIDQISECR